MKSPPPAVISTKTPVPSPKHSPKQSPKLMSRSRHGTPEPSKSNKAGSRQVTPLRSQATPVRNLTPGLAAAQRNQTPVRGSASKKSLRASPSCPPSSTRKRQLQALDGVQPPPSSGRKKPLKRTQSCTPLPKSAKRIKAELESGDGGNDNKSKESSKKTSKTAAFNLADKINVQTACSMFVDKTEGSASASGEHVDTADPALALQSKIHENLSADSAETTRLRIKHNLKFNWLFRRATIDPTDVNNDSNCKIESD